MRRRRRSERGAALVEAAFAVPIFLILFMGLADLGLAAVQTSQASSGAVDGGRAGVVLATPPDSTNCATDPGYQKIVGAVQKRIPGRDLGCENVTLTCSKPDGTVVNCLVADTLNDKLTVEVHWVWEPISPAGHSLPLEEIRGHATMKFIPQPAPPPGATSTSIPVVTTTTTTPVAPLAEPTGPVS